MSNPINNDSSFLFDAFNKAMAKAAIRQKNATPIDDPESDWENDPIVSRILSPSSVDENRILPFYIGQGTDWRARKIDEVWSFTLEQLEDSHDYIQWLFPLREPSGSHPGAPKLTDHEITQFHNDKELQQRLNKSFKTMLGFYGLCYDGDTIKELETFPKRKKVWLSRENHNLLRITRIIKSLNVLGLEKESRALYEFLDRFHSTSNVKILSNETLNFWRLAAYPPSIQ